MKLIIARPNSQYPVGTRIISIQGETSDTDDAQDVITGPNAKGVISQVLTDQEHCYLVDFPLGVSVFLSPSEIVDSNKYLIVPNTRWYEKEGLTLMNQRAHSVSLVKLTSGDVGLILDGKFVLTADPNFEPTEQVTQASSNLAAVLGVELNIIEIDPPSNDDWNWDDVLILINNPVLEQKLSLSN